MRITRRQFLKVSGAAAVAVLEQIAGDSHDASSMTHLAEAYLAAGEPRKAIELADVAIDEFDSIHGRSWLVRGDARRALGDLDGAARDYNKALEGDDEVGIEEGALARLAEIDRPVTDLDPED